MSTFLPHIMMLSDSIAAEEATQRSNSSANRLHENAAIAWFPMKFGDTRIQGVSADTLWFPTVTHAIYGLRLEMFYPGATNLYFASTRAGDVPACGITAREAFASRDVYELTPGQEARWVVFKKRFLTRIHNAKFNYNRLATEAMIVARRQNVKPMFFEV